MARKDEFEFDIPSKNEKKEKPQREKGEGKKLFGDGSLFSKSSSDKSFSFDVSEKKSIFNKVKKEKPESFDTSFEKKQRSGKSEDFSMSMDLDSKKTSKRLKWWHILLIALGAILIVVAIVAGILIGKANDMVSGGEGGGVDEIPETEGVISTVGTFLPSDAQEYILCEYTEYFSGENVIVLQKPKEVRYDYKTYWVFITEDGQPDYHFSDEFPENDTPEQVKKDLFDVLQVFGYTEEILALCDMHVYEPVSFTRVNISEVTLTDTEITVKYSAGAVDGEMSEEYTLTGTYTKVDNDYTFTYAELPEDENLLLVAENLLAGAKYEYYAMYGSWVNELTFGDSYKLTLTSPTEE